MTGGKINKEKGQFWVRCPNKGIMNANAAQK